MNYTKYLIALIIFNFCMAVVANIDYFSDVTPNPDLSLVKNTTQSTERGATSIFNLTTFLIDTAILAIKITLLAPYYTGQTLKMFGLHPLITWMIIGINYMVYVMWIIDVKRGKTFF